MARKPGRPKSLPSTAVRMKAFMYGVDPFADEETTTAQRAALLPLSKIRALGHKNVDSYLWSLVGTAGGATAEHSRLLKFRQRRINSPDFKLEN